MKLTTIEADPLLNKAKANKFALWRTFDYIGKNALVSVIQGRLTMEKADHHIQMLRRMLLEGATMSAVYNHLLKSGLIREEDDIDFQYYKA